MDSGRSKEEKLIFMKSGMSEDNLGGLVHLFAKTGGD